MKLGNGSRLSWGQAVKRGTVCRELKNNCNEVCFLLPPHVLATLVSFSDKYVYSSHRYGQLLLHPTPHTHLCAVFCCTFKRCLSWKKMLPRVYVLKLSLLFFFHEKKLQQRENLNKMNEFIVINHKVIMHIKNPEESCH